MKKEKLWIAIVAGLAFVLGLYALGRSVAQLRRSQPSVTVTGMAERNFKSDLIVWTASYQLQMMDLESAYKALKEKQILVADYLKNKQLPDSSYIFSSVAICKEYNYYYAPRQEQNVRTFAGYLLSQTVTVTSQDIEHVEKISRDITELINQGVEITSDRPAYYCTKLNDLKVEMLRNASEDAFNRASVIAEGSGSSVGKMLSSSMGVFQIVGLNSNEDYSWGGSFNTSSKMKTASITVKASFALK